MYILRNGYGFFLLKTGRKLDSEFYLYFLESSYLYIFSFFFGIMRLYDVTNLKFIMADTV